MNYVEINEINEMREQLATLKRQLNSQQIVNDRLLKEAMATKQMTQIAMARRWMVESLFDIASLSRRSLTICCELS